MSTIDPPTSTTVPTTLPPCHGRWMSPEFERGLVSVIVPTYNRAHLITDSLDSVHAQIYRPIELLIIDDGSTDNTSDVINEWQCNHQQDGFTTRYILQENRGAQAARNLGLIESRGEFIQFLDSDDLIHPEKHAHQVAALRKDEHIKFAYSQHRVFIGEPDWSLEPYQWQSFDATLENLLNVRLFIQTAGGLYRRNACLEIGPWNESLRVSHEVEYDTRLLMVTSATQYVPGVFTLARLHNTGQISDLRSTPDAVRAGLDATKAIAQAAHVNSFADKTLRNAMAKRFAVVGRAALKISDYELANECSRYGWQLQPSMNIKSRLLFVDFFTAMPAIVFRGCSSVARLFPKSTPFRHAFVSGKWSS